MPLDMSDLNGNTFLGNGTMNTFSGYSATQSVNGTDPAARQIAVAQQREMWLRQRTIEQARNEAVTELGRSESANGVEHTPVTVPPEQVLDSLAIRLENSIRNEILAQVDADKRNQAISQAREGKQLEKYLAAEIQSHQCPVCMELMAAPQRPPNLLFPCGHSFCGPCLDEHMRVHRRTTCPLCRSPIQSHALNVALQQVIGTYVARRSSLTNGEQWSTPPTQTAAPTPVAMNGHWSDDVVSQSLDAALPRNATPEQRDAALQYLREYRMTSLRCRVLRNELDDTDKEHTALQPTTLSSMVVLDHLKREADEAARRVAHAQAEFTMIRAQLEQQETKHGQLNEQLAQLDSRRQLIRRTLEPLQQSNDKARLLLESIVPGVRLE